MDNFIHTKCYEIKDLQEKLIGLRVKICQMTELNIALKETTKLHETLNSVPLTSENTFSTLRINSAGSGNHVWKLLPRNTFHH